MPFGKGWERDGTTRHVCALFCLVEVRHEKKEKACRGGCRSAGRMIPLRGSSRGKVNGPCSLGQGSRFYASNHSGGNSKEECLAVNQDVGGSTPLPRVCVRPARSIIAHAQRFTRPLRRLPQAGWP